MSARTKNISHGTNQDFNKHLTYVLKSPYLSKTKSMQQFNPSLRTREDFMKQSVPKDREGFMNAMASSQRPHTVYSKNSVTRSNIDKIANSRQNTSNDQERTLSLQKSQNLAHSASQRSTFLKAMEKPNTVNQFRQSLYFDKRTKTIPKTNIKNPYAENLIIYGNELLTKDSLMKNIYRLKDMKLLQPRKVFIEKQGNDQGCKFVYNDYHARNTNMGYSRKADGTYFQK